MQRFKLVKPKCGGSPWFYLDLSKIESFRPGHEDEDQIHVHMTSGAEYRLEDKGHVLRDVLFDLEMEMGD